MGWSIGYDDRWKRDIGYGVPAQCDHPDCTREINRGLAHVCGSQPYGGDHGCGLYFCDHHLTIHEVDGEFVQLCERCAKGEKPYEPSVDLPIWTHHKATDESWASWRAEQSTPSSGGD